MHPGNARLHALKHLKYLRLACRMLLAPAVVGVLAGAELARLGAGAATAVVGAYAVLFAAQGLVVLWGRWQLHRARRRLAAARARSQRLPRGNRESHSVVRRHRVI